MRSLAHRRLLHRRSDRQGQATPGPARDLAPARHPEPPAETAHEPRASEGHRCHPPPTRSPICSGRSRRPAPPTVSSASSRTVGSPSARTLPGHPRPANGSDAPSRAPALRLRHRKALLKQEDPKPKRIPRQRPLHQHRLAATHHDRWSSHNQLLSAVDYREQARKVRAITQTSTAKITAIRRSFRSKSACQRSGHKGSCRRRHEPLLPGARPA